MVNFQYGTIIIASFFLVVTLSIIAISFSKTKQDRKYPPVISECPDYWIDISGNTCVNRHLELGNSNCEKKMDFSGSIWLGETGKCEKKKWAKHCNLTWDGITNNDDIC
jgi:hypothetical protein